MTQPWNSMELKSGITAVFLLSLFLATPYPSKGRSSDVADPEIYEIDYRGPQTHSKLPPPAHSRGWPRIHRGSNVASTEIKDLGGGNTREISANKNVHG
uniref:Uncharacterized protein n=2 Tax=Rhizophora mucronata TaxID=61149 RepID=A0A2P2J9U2_RHIMU